MFISRERNCTWQSWSCHWWDPPVFSEYCRGHSIFCPASASFSGRVRSRFGMKFSCWGLSWWTMTFWSWETMYSALLISLFSSAHYLEAELCFRIQTGLRNFLSMSYHHCNLFPLSGDRCAQLDYEKPFSNDVFQL